MKGLKDRAFARQAPKDSLIKTRFAILPFGSSNCRYYRRMDHAGERGTIIRLDRDPE